MTRPARTQRLGDLLARSAARKPGKIAIIYKELRQSFADLNECVNRTANALAERGIRRGDHIVLLSHNNHAFVVLRFAIVRLGAVLVPVNFMLNAEEIAFILRHSEASAFVAEDSLVPVADAAISESGQSIPVRGYIPENFHPAPPGWEHVTDWMAHADASPPNVPIGDDEPVQLLYTSGTESRPKGVMLTARNLYANYASVIIGGEMTEDDIEIHSLPFYHCAQLDCFLTPDLYLGATSIILPAPDPQLILAAIESERATKLFCAPTVWISLLRHPDFDRRDLSSLRKAYYGASIMPVEIVREIGARLPSVRLFNLYGQTEMSPLATILGPADQLRKPGSAGKAALNVETMVVDEDDQPVPCGQIGEIVHRGPHVCLGYWRDADKTKEAFRHGWFHSGDLGVLDDEGYLTVVDRKKDMIKTGGENVASSEVEDVLYQHPGIAQAAVFGIPHPKWIEAVAAVVVLRIGQEHSVEALMAYCRTRLAGYKAPKYMVIAPDLPRNPSGKILKRELRLRWQALLDEQGR